MVKNPSVIQLKSLLFGNLAGYQRRFIKQDFIAALVVTAIAIPESLGFAVIVGLPVQAGLYCALVAPIVFAIFTSSKRLIVGADSATAALVAAGAATVAVAGTQEYAGAIAALGLVTAAVLLVMSAARLGFLADLISRPVLAGFISGVGVQLIVGKLPEMLGLSAHGDIFAKAAYLAGHLGGIHWLTAGLAALTVAIVVAGWKLRWPGAIIALALAIGATAVFGLEARGVEVVGTVPAGLPPLRWPELSVDIVFDLIPAAFSIAVVILAQSLAVIRSAAARHEEAVKDNQDLMALGLANAASAVVGGFAINGSPPRTSAAEMAGGRSQLVNVMMAGLIGLVLVVATGLFAYVPVAALAAIVFCIGLHLIKVRDLREIWQMRRSEFWIALAALAGVAALGVQRGVILAVIMSLIERLRRQYHPSDEVLLRDQEYAPWAADRFGEGRHQLDAPAGLLCYRFGDALFFENSGYFYERVTAEVAAAKQPVKCLVLDASAITDVDFTAAGMLGRLIGQLDADDIQLAIAHVSPRVRRLLKQYGIIDLIGADYVYPSLRFAIEDYSRRQFTHRDRIAALKLDANDYVVIGGAVLDLLGIRPTNDVDLVVSKRAFQTLKDRGWREYIQDDGKKILIRRGYKVMLTWMGRSLDDLRKAAVLSQGIPLMSLDDLEDCKMRLGRKKDLEDIVLMKYYMAHQAGDAMLRG